MDQYQFVRKIKNQEHHDPDETFELAHFPLPQRLGGKEVMRLHPVDHIIQGLYQSAEFNCRCFYNGNTYNFLYKSKGFCENWFELCDIYHQYAGEGLTSEGRSKGAKVGNVLHNKPQKMMDAWMKPVSLIHSETNEVCHFTSSQHAIQFLGLSSAGISMLRNKARPVHKKWRLFE